MFKHDDKEFEFVVNLLAQQRDHAMGQAAVLYKENAILKLRLAELAPEEKQQSSKSD